MSYFQNLLILLDGLLAGLFVGSSMVEHAAGRLAAREWLAYKQAKEEVFGPVMPTVFGIALLATMAGAALGPGHAVLAVAAGLMSVVLFITKTVHIPLNLRFQTWRATDYAVTWDADRRRWRQWNLLRAALVVAAFALVIVATA